MATQDFKLKGSVVTTVVLEVLGDNDVQIIHGISDKVAAAPSFFLNAPLLISFADHVNLTAERLSHLSSSLNELKFAVIGWRQNDELQYAWQPNLSIPRLSNAKRAAEKPILTAAEVTPQQNVEAPRTTIIDKPIRSGQQVYAKGDLVVLAAVSPGAEILAEGSIHVYGALRGRALAGVSGNEQARIFCRSLEAELVSIAGNFMLSDSMETGVWSSPAQIYLVNDKLNVAAL